MGGIGLFSFIMALGPFLRVNGAELTNIPLPYALIGDRFPLNILRSPDRYNLMLALALAPLAAWGVQDVLVAIKARAGRSSGTASADSYVRAEPSIMGGVVIGAIILFEYLGVPYPTIDPLPTSPFQKQLAQDGENYAVLDIPLDRSDTKRYLYYQTQHEKSTVQGRVARVPAEAYALFNRIPLLSAWQRQHSGQAPARPWRAVAAAGRSKCALHHPAQGPRAAGSGDVTAQLFHPAPGLRGRSDRGILYGARGAARPADHG